MSYILDLVKLLLVLGVIAYGAFYIMKKVKKRQLSQISENNLIKVLDGVHIAMNQGLYLVKIGEELVAITSGANGVHMLKLEQKEIRKTFEKERFEEMLLTDNKKDMTLQFIQNLVKGMKGGRKNEKNENK